MRNLLLALFTPTWGQYTFLILSALLLLGLGFFPASLAGRDEAFLMQMTREHLQQGGGLAPLRYQGAPFPGAGPAFSWCVEALFAFTGELDWVGRLPGLAAATLGILLAAWVSSQASSRKVAPFLGGALLLTSPLLYVAAHSASPGAPGALCFLAAWAAMVAAERAPPLAILAGPAAGLGALFLGAPGLWLFLAFLFACLASRLPAAASSPTWWLGNAAGLLLLGGWYASQVNDLGLGWLWGHLLAPMRGLMWQFPSDPGAPWESVLRYPLALAWGFFPWVIFLPWGLFLAWEEGKEEDGERTRAWLMWLLAGYAPFLLRPHPDALDLLPFLPLCAVLTARFMAELLEARRTPNPRWLHLNLGITILGGAMSALAGVAYLLASQEPHPNTHLLLLFATFLQGVALVLAGLSFRSAWRKGEWGDRRGWLGYLVAGPYLAMLLLSMGGGLWDHSPALKNLGQRVPDGEIHLLRLSSVDPSTYAEARYYLRRPVRSIGLEELGRISAPVLVCGKEGEFGQGGRFELVQKAGAFELRRYLP